MSAVTRGGLRKSLRTRLKDCDAKAMSATTAAKPPEEEPLPPEEPDAAPPFAGAVGSDKGARGSRWISREVSSLPAPFDRDRCPVVPKDAAVLSSSRG
jgi:hypothetical protein